MYTESDVVVGDIPGMAQLVDEVDFGIAGVYRCRFVYHRVVADTIVYVDSTADPDKDMPYRFETIMDKDDDEQNEMKWLTKLQTISRVKKAATTF